MFVLISFHSALILNEGCSASEGHVMSEKRRNTDSVGTPAELNPAMDNCSAGLRLCYYQL